MNLGMESETVEFKKSTSELDKALISIVAMLNKHKEGMVYFGVKNNGDVIGQKDITESTLRDISRKIAENIKPQIIPTITLELIDNKNVIKVLVKGNNIPYCAFNIFYIRSFDEDRVISVENIKELINYGGEPDLIIKEPTIRTDLKFNMLKTQYSIHGFTINNKEFERNNKLYTFDGRYNYMAELLSDENDISIKVVTFKGKDKSIMLDRTEFGGKCLILAVDEVIRHVNAINTTKVKLGGIFRQEEKFFDTEVFKEAWLNAVVHNRWIEKIPPAVYIYDDRIEVVSNGGLPKSLSKADFFKGVSKPVNKELLEIFTKLDVIEQTGHGIPLIIKRYGKKAFYISEHTIIVTIPLNKVSLEGYQDYEDLTDNERKVFKEIINLPSITINEISKNTLIGEKNVGKILTNLKNKGYLKRDGSNKTGIWKVLK